MGCHANFLVFPGLILIQLRMDEHEVSEFCMHVYGINEFAAFKAEVQFEKKDMARTIGCSPHRCNFDSIFCGKTEGIESDTPE